MMKKLVAMLLMLMLCVGLAVTASAATTFTVTIDSAITGGTVTADKNEAAAGDTVTLTAVPANGYELSKYTVTDANGTPVTVTNGVFTMPEGNVTVAAEFKITSRSIIFYANNGTDQTYVLNKSTTSSLPTAEEYGFTAPEGKVLKGWALNSVTGSMKLPGWQNYSISGGRALYAIWTDPVASVTIGGTTTSYGNLIHAFSAADGKTATITLLSDWDNSLFAEHPQIKLSASKVTFDLNGHKISNSNSSESNALEFNGECVIKNGEIEFTGGGQYIRFYSSAKNSKLTINGDVKITNTNPYGNAVLVSGGANTVSVESGAEIAVPNKSNTDKTGAITLYKDATLIVNGGTISSSGSKDTDIAAYSTSNTNTTVVVNGGSFDTVKADNVYFNVDHAAIVTANVTGNAWYKLTNGISAEVAAVTYGTNTTTYDGNVYGLGGADVTITAVPNTGYTVDIVKANETEATKSGNDFTFAMPKALVTLTAEAGSAAPTVYSVTASANPAEGGTVSGAGEYAEGENVTLTATANEGYTFVNWTENGTQVSTDATISFTAAGDRELVANFTKNTYTVTYKPGANGTGTEIFDTKTEGETLTLKGAIFTRTGHKQTGWATTDGGEKAYDLNGSYTTDAAADLYPVWEAETYTITYVLNEGTINGEYPTTYTYGVGATLPTDVTREGFTFKYWSSDAAGSYPTGSIGTSSSGEKTYYAQWEEIVVPETYTVTYNPGANGTGTEIFDTKTEGEILTLKGAIFTRTGHKQTGWATTDGGEKAYDLNGSYTTDAEVELYPVWEAETYTITYVLNGGTINGEYPTTYTYGVGTTLPTDVTREGFTFKYWSSDAEGNLPTGSIGESASGNKTYYAQWEEIVVPETYTVTYKPGANGTGTEIFDTKTEGEILTLKGAIFTRTGHKQTGWATTDGGEKAYDLNGSYTTDAAADLYPVWEAETYTITYVLNEGTINGEYPTTYTYGVGATLPTDVTREGFSFKGWYTASEGGTGPIGSIGTEASGSKTYYAQWQKNAAPVYIVTVSNDGNGIGTATPASGITGTEVTLAVTPNSGYRFKEWQVISGGITITDNKLIISTANVEVKAIFERIPVATYTVTFDPNGGSGTMVPQTFTEGVAQNLTLNAFNREGFIFTGWNTAADGSGTSFADGASVTASSSATLYAQWQKNAAPVYIVTVSNDGNGIGMATPSSGTTGTEVTLAATPNDGYRFKEWQVISGGVTVADNKLTIGTTNVEVKAIFEPIPVPTFTVTVSNDVNGTGTAMPASGITGTEVTLTATPNSGYRFKEWQVISGGVTVTDNKLTIGTANVEVKAIFELIPASSFTVTFDPNGGSGTMVPQTFTEGIAQSLTLNAFTREGFAFIGWNTAADGSGTSFADGASVTASSNASLYAQWKAVPVVTPLTITKQPTDQFVVEGQRAEFSVEAAGDGLTYQWYINRNDGRGWRELDGAIGTAYVTSVTDLECDGFQYGCLITDQYGNILKSDVAVLHVSKVPVLPETGDSSTPMLWLAMSILSMAGILLLRKKAYSR